MLVDRSARIWAMRHDEMMISAAAAQREALRAPGAVAQSERLEGSDFARVVDGVAVIPVYGLLLRKMNWFFWSYEEIMRDVALAQADRSVDAILLDIDSPGGLVAGCSDAARAIWNSGPKPVESFVGGMGASAAYYIASAGSRITVGSGAVVGSVGTVIEYVDMEPLIEKMGARMVRVVAKQSPNKRLDPNSPEGQAEMQALVDAGCAEFVADVAAFRGISAAEVMDNFGQGLVFDGAAAIERGMADQRSTLSTIIAELAGRDAPNAVPAPAAQETPMDWASLTTASLREHRADLVTEIEASATAAASTQTETRVQEAVAAERARIAAIDELAVDGHEDLVAAAKADGRSAEAFAVDLLKAEKAAGGTYLKQLREADASAGVEPAPVGAETTAAAETDEEKAEAKWNSDAGLRSEFGGDKGAYLAFAKAEAAGKARVLRRAS